MRYLHQECGAELVPRVAAAAVVSGDTGVAAWVLQQGGRGLFADREAVWRAAAYSGSVDMVRWLVGEGFMGGGSIIDKVAAAETLVAAGRWCFRVPGRKQFLAALLEAVKAVFGPSCAPCSTSTSTSGIGGSGGEGRGSGGCGDLYAGGPAGSTERWLRRCW